MLGGIIPRFERTAWCGDDLDGNWLEGRCYSLTWCGFTLQLSWGREMGETIFAVAVMVLAAIALVTFGDWIDGHIDEALDEAFRESATARNLKLGGEPSNPASGGDADKPFSDHGEAGL